ncbi:MAG: DUF4232 domain-containing protein [Actinoallomurus sp.]
MSRCGFAAAGLALLSVAACQNNGSPQSANPSSSAPAASSSADASSAAAPTPTRTSGSGTTGATAPACTAADLNVTLGPADSGAGQRHTTLSFRTAHGKTCVLTNDLTGFRFLRGDGTPLPTSASPASDPHAFIILRPGTTGRLDLSFSVVSGQPFTPHLLKFTVPADGGGADTVVWGAGPVGDNGRLQIGRLHF